MIRVITIAVLLALAGCASVDCSNSDSASFPQIERWWK